jgi:hypothetical protein
MRLPGVQIWSSDGVLREGVGDERSAPDYNIRVEHGRLFQNVREAHKSHYVPTLLVSDAAVALEAAFALNVAQTDVHIRIAPINAQQDGMVWLPKLARMRVWSIRNGNRVEVLLDGHASEYQRGRWLVYNSTKEMAPDTSALSNRNRQRYE